MSVNRVYVPAGKEYVDTVFKLVLGTGEGFPVDPKTGQLLGHLDKKQTVLQGTEVRTGYVPPKQGKTTNDVANTWGTTKGAVDDFYRVKKLPHETKRDSLIAENKKLEREIRKLEKQYKMNPFDNSASALIDTKRQTIAKNISDIAVKQSIINDLDGDRRYYRKLKNLTLAKAQEFFEFQRYKGPRFDELPKAVAGVATDFGFISDPSNAVRALRKIFGVKTKASSSRLDDKTLEAVNTFIADMKKQGKDGEAILADKLKVKYDQHLTYCANKKTKVVNADGSISYVKKKSGFTGWKTRPSNVAAAAKEYAAKAAKAAESFWDLTFVFPSKQDVLKPPADRTLTGLFQSDWSNHG